MFALLLSVLVCISILQATSANLQPTIKSLNGGGALHFLEHTIRSLSNNSDFRLPNEYRNADGNLRHAPLGASTGSPAACVGGSTLSSVTSGGVTVNYNFAPVITTSLTSVPTSVCFYVAGTLGAVNVNYNPSAHTASQSSIPVLFGGQNIGLHCDNCWAYIGATISMSVICSLSGTTATCNMAFETTGQSGFNFNMALTNPQWTTTLTNNNILSSTPTITLFTDPDTAITITATPSLGMSVGGSIQATGSSSISAGVNAQAGLGVQLAGTALTFAPTGSVNWNLPAITATGFALTNMDTTMSVSVIPTVQWSFAIGCNNAGSPSTAVASPMCIPAQGSCTSASESTGLGFEIILQTPIINTATFISNATSCTNSLGSSALASMSQMNLIMDVGCCNPSTCGNIATCTSVSNGCESYNILSSSVSTSSQPLGDPITGNQCIFKSYSAVTASSSSSSSSSLSGGEIAAAVILPIAAVAVGLGVYYYYSQQSKSQGLSSNRK